MEFTTITRRVGEICGVDANADRARPALRRPRRLARPQRRAIAPAPSRPRARRRAGRAAPRAGRARASAPPSARPSDLAAARAARGARRKRSTSRAYATVTDADELDALDRARVRRRASSPSTPRPRRSIRMQADLVGVSLGVAPGEACYIPIGHRAGDGDLFGGGGLAARPDRRGRGDRAAEAAARRPGRAEDRPERQVRLARLRPARRRGRAVRRHHADLLRARFRRDRRRPRHGRARRALARPQDRSHFAEVAGSGRSFIGFARVAIDKATRIRRRGRRRDAAAVARAEAAPRRRGDDDGLRDAGAAAGRAAGADGAARRRRSTARCCRACRASSRKGMARHRGRGAEARRRAVQPRLAQAARRHPVRPDGPAGRQEDRDRRLVDLGERARGSRRRGPRTAARASSTGASSPS